MSWEYDDITRECACGRGTYTVRIYSNNAKIQTQAGIPKIHCDRCRARFSLRIDPITGEETWNHPPIARLLR